MSTRPPVTDWSTDFDHLDPRWVEDPYPIWDELRDKCPVAHTDRFQGVYLPTRYEDVCAVAYDTEHFSSRRMVVRDKQPPLVPAPPITSDPPSHGSARRVLLPPFRIEAIQRHEPKIHDICCELIGRFAGKTGCDGAVDYAQEIPLRVTAHMLGIPETDGEQFRKWIFEILELGITDSAAVVRATEEMNVYFAEKVENRRAAPDDDLISYLINARIEGQLLEQDYILGTLRLLLIAGIDTTWSAIGCCLWHLSQHPDDCRRLVAEPGLMPLAVEEFLRAYAPATTAREVIRPTQIGGCPLREGQMVLLSFPAANRDPAMFDRANGVVIDRKENRHLAFGIGIHRCIGSNLARMEIAVALEEWLKAIPEFHLDRSCVTKWSAGTVRGPRRLPIVFGRSEQVGC